VIPHQFAFSIFFGYVGLMTFCRSSFQQDAGLSGSSSVNNKHYVFSSDDGESFNIIIHCVNSWTNMYAHVLFPLWCTLLGDIDGSPPVAARLVCRLCLHWQHKPKNKDNATSCFHNLQHYSMYSMSSSSVASPSTTMQHQYIRQNHSHPIIQC